MRDQLSRLLTVAAVVIVFEQFSITSLDLTLDWFGGAAQGILGIFLVVGSLSLVSAGRRMSNTSLGGRILSVLDYAVQHEKRSPWQRITGAVAVSAGALGMATSAAWICHALQLPANVWTLALCLAVMGILLWRKFRTVEARFEVRDGHPGACEALIIFLSRNTAVNGNPLRHPLASRREPDVAMEDMRARFGADNWLMPLLSIRLQLEESRKLGQPQLRYLLIIASKESHAQVAAFTGMVDQWIPVHGIHIEETTQSYNGVDFADPRTLWRTIAAAYERAAELGAKSVMLDITGGKAQCSAAGAIACLAPGRYFKYVDTNTYQQHEYSIGLEIERPELG